MPNPKESFADWMDANKCAEILREERWPDGVVRCPYCESDDVCKLESYQEVFFRYECRRCSEEKGQKTTFNDKTKTMYEDSKVPITKWFHAKNLLSNKVSDLKLSKELQVDYKTARRMSILIKGTLFFV